LLSDEVSEWCFDTAGNSDFNTLFFFRTVMNESAKLMVVINFVCEAVIMFSFKYTCCLCAVTWLEGKNKYIGLMVIKQIV
jgi:hypothetical protein